MREQLTRDRLSINRGYVPGGGRALTNRNAHKMKRRALSARPYDLRGVSVD